MTSVPAVADPSRSRFFYLKRLFFKGRRTRLFGLGTNKSGTHSLAEMFSRGIRVGHEAEAEALIQKVLDAQAGRLSREELIRWVRARDRKLALDVDSSQLNFFLLDILLQEFPKARFVLTIRDAYSWVDSLMNHLLNHPQTSPEWVRMRNVRFRADVLIHAPEEQVLKEKGLHTLDGYLAYWAEHNGGVIARVPAERLFVVRTNEIQQRALEIADFARLPRHALNLERVHAFKNPKKFYLVRQLDREFVEQKVAKHCRPLMEQFFPEIKTLDDSKL